jgi:hypothetical protein
MLAADSRLGWAMALLHSQAPAVRALCVKQGYLNLKTSTNLKLTSMPAVRALCVKQGYTSTNLKLTSMPAVCAHNLDAVYLIHLGHRLRSYQNCLYGIPGDAAVAQNIATKLAQVSRLQQSRLARLAS